MTTGSMRVSIALSILILSIALNPVMIRSDSGAGPQPDSIFQVDVPFWMIGDSWTYDTHLHLEMGLNYTDLVGSSTFTVTEMFNVTQNGTYHEAYNVSVAGSFTGSGYADMGGIQATITVTSASLTGFHWLDRSDLSLIRDNETIDGTGNVRILFFTYPLALRFATESNRSPTQEDYDFPLLPGDTWQYYGNMRSLGYYYYMVTGTPWGDIGGTIPFDHNTTMDFDARLQDEMDIDVGGNPLHCYHVNQTSLNVSARGGDTHIYYSPVAKNYVRQRLVASTVDYVMVGFNNLTSFSLSSPPYPVSMTLDPQILNPGGYLNVTGSAGSAATVTVMTPWNASSASVLTGSSGDYQFRIRAPTFDDYTPCNADVGSFGVIVESVDTSMRRSFNTSTLVLLMPDLSIAASDIGFSSPPSVGVPTTILAVVHESVVVGVYETVAVDFLLDGSFLAGDSVAFMFEGTQHTFAAIWTPTAGFHTIGVMVDPSDSVIESNEGNNYAELGAATALPDVVPWNITLTDGGSSHYTDPGTVGFASAWVNASLGETLDISFNVRNNGNWTFSGPLRVIAVETQGLRGPPIAPPFYDFTFNGTIDIGNEAIMPPATWPIPTVLGGSYFINVTVDPDNNVSETYESNNTFAIRLVVGAPDMAVFANGPPKVPVGGSGYATVLAENTGDRVSPATTVEVRNSTSGVLLGTLPVAALAAGANAQQNFDLSSLAAIIGSHCLLFTIDPANTIQEASETNNTRTWCLEVTPLPETTLSLDGPSYTSAPITYIKSTTNITLTAVDHSGTNIKSTDYRVEGGSWIHYSIGTAIHLSGDGAHTIQFNSTDNVGGAEQTKQRTLIVDDTAPVSMGNWNGTAASISASDAGSGVNATYYRLDSGALTLYAGAVVVTTPGQHIIAFYSVDNLQNIEQQQTLSFTVGGGDGEILSSQENLKPYIALAFVLVLLCMYAYLRRRDKGKSLLLVAGLFMIIEVATGALSFAVDALVYSPNQGKNLALYIDIAILIVGLAAMWIKRKDEGRTPAKEAVEEAVERPEEKP